jgi:hypothetical protein
MASEFLAGCSLAASFCNLRTTDLDTKTELSCLYEFDAVLNNLSAIPLNRSSIRENRPLADSSQVTISSGRPNRSKCTIYQQALKPLSSQSLPPSTQPRRPQFNNNYVSCHITAHNSTLLILNESRSLQAIRNLTVSNLSEGKGDGRLEELDRDCESSYQGG